MWKSTTPFQITMSKLCALRPFWEVFFNRIREKGYKGWPSQNKTMGKKGRQMKTGDIYYIYASHHVCLCWSSDSKAFPYTCLLACVLAASNRGMGVSLSPGECEWTGLQFFHPSAPPGRMPMWLSTHTHAERESVWEQLWSYMQADTGQNTCWKCCMCKISCNHEYLFSQNNRHSQGHCKVNSKFLFMENVSNYLST